jgi:hypothetical protein
VLGKIVFFDKPIDRSALVEKLVEVRSIKPVTSQQIEDFCQEHHLSNASVKELEKVQTAYHVLRELVSGLAPLSTLWAMMYLPTLVVLATSAGERNGCTQYFQLVNGHIQETNKNKPGWSTNVHFLFLRS